MRVLAEWQVPDPSGGRLLSCMHIFSADNMRQAALCAEWFLSLAADRQNSDVSQWSGIRVTIEELEDER